MDAKTKNYQETWTREIVTPEVAREWLSHNHNNRNLKQAAIKRYAEDMKNDRWVINGNNNIVFGVSGNLIDGQNRLNAVIRADVTVVMGVMRNIRDEARESMDQGTKRSTSDVFKMNGIKNYSRAAAASTLLASLRRGYDVAGNTRSHVSASEALEAYHLAPMMDDIVTDVTRHASLYQWGGRMASMISGVGVFIAEGDGGLIEHYMDFVETTFRAGIRTDGTRSNVCTMAFKVFDADSRKRSGDGMSQDQRALVWAKAWASYCECEVYAKKKFSMKRGWQTSKYDRDMNGKTVRVGAGVEIVR